MSKYTPEKLFQLLHCCDYGYISNGKRKTENLGNFEDYLTLSPKELITYKIGTCWDFTTYEYLFFRKYMINIPVKCFYIEAEDNSTHTWLVFYKNNLVNIFEYSWYDLRGIHTFNTETEMLNFYTIRFLNTVHPFNDTFAIYTYIPPKQYHLNPDQFMYYVTTTGQFINDTNSYHTIIERYNAIYKGGNNNAKSIN